MALRGFKDVMRLVNDNNYQELDDTLSSYSKAKLQAIFNLRPRAPADTHEPLGYPNYMRYQHNPSKNKKESLLETAIKNGYAECVEILLKHGIPICRFATMGDVVVDRRFRFRNDLHDLGVGDCPMHFAVVNCHKDIILSLLQHGGNPDCYHGCKMSNTPLFEILSQSSSSYNQEVAKMLVYFGAFLPVDTSRLISTILMNGNVIERLTFFIGVGLQVDNLYLKYWYTNLLVLLNRNVSRSLAPDTMEEARELLRQIGIADPSQNTKCSDSVSNDGKDTKDDKTSETMPTTEENSKQKNALDKDQDLAEDNDKNSWVESGQLDLQERCRITIRDCLISNSHGKLILPQVQKLYLPERLKQYVSFDTYLEYMDFIVKINLNSD